MRLTLEEKDMLNGKYGKAAKKSMEILTTLGEIFEAESMVDVYGVQIAGVSYANLGEAGLDFLNEMAQDGRVRVLTTLNPAGMDRENWEALGIDKEFARNQNRVIDAFAKMGGSCRIFSLRSKRGLSRGSPGTYRGSKGSAGRP